MVFDTQVYAEKDELKVAIEAYLKGNHEEYFKTFDRTSWLPFYKKNISSEVSILSIFLSICTSLRVKHSKNLLFKIMKQFRSVRGALAAKVRESLFNFFGEDNLSRINTSATPMDILNWKKSDEVKKCSFTNLLNFS